MLENRANPHYSLNLALKHIYGRVALSVFYIIETQHKTLRINNSGILAGKRVHTCTWSSYLFPSAQWLVNTSN